MAEFNIYPRDNPALSLYSDSDKDLAREFAKRLYKEFGNFLKAVVLFGSVARGESKKKKGDIDVLVIIDDVTIQLSHEMITTYRIIVEGSELHYFLLEPLQ